MASNSAWAPRPRFMHVASEPRAPIKDDEELVALQEPFRRFRPSRTHDSDPCHQVLSYRDYVALVFCLGVQNRSPSLLPKKALGFRPMSKPGAMVPRAVVPLERSAIHPAHRHQSLDGWSASALRLRIIGLRLGAPSSSRMAALTNRVCSVGRTPYPE